MGSIVGFILILGTVFVGTSLYVGFRLIRPLGLRRPWNALAWILLVALAVMTPAVVSASRISDGDRIDALGRVAFAAFGLYLFLFVYTLARDLMWAPVRLLVLRNATMAKAWLRRTSLLVIGAAVVSLAIGMVQALSGPRVVRVGVPIEGLHPDLDGMRIVQLSDIHLSVWIDGEDLKKIVALTNSLRPELVVITGDLADGSVARRGKDAMPLSEISAPAYFVTGNHDYYSGAEAWIGQLRRLRVHVVDGENWQVRRGTARVLVSGVADPAGDGMGRGPRRSPAALAAASGPSDLKILLAHRSSDAYAAAKAGFDLQLSGHTHGGQSFPWTLVIDWFQPFATGLHRYEGMWIHTSRGCGFWGPPIRLLNPPEVILLTLERTAAT